MNTDDKCISEFWTWFVHNSETLQLFHDVGDVSRIDTILAHRLTFFGHELGWEIGVDASGHRYFALSPKLYPDRLILTKSIIAKSPVLPGWVFVSAKPRRPWSGSVMYMNKNNESVQIDMSDWKYRLTLYREAAFVDVEVFTGILPAMDSTAREQVSTTALVGLLGEELFMRIVGEVGINPVDRPTESVLTPLSCLYDHIISININ